MAAKKSISRSVSSLLGNVTAVVGDVATIAKQKMSKAGANTVKKPAKKALKSKKILKAKNTAKKIAKKASKRAKKATK